jgi:acyl-coenzyme A thioesterase PaaI-like protein
VSRADAYEPLPPERAAVWAGYGQWDETYFPKLIGLAVEEVRADYCRMRLPWRAELTQPAGVVHGGAIAALVDSVVVPSIGSG